MNERLLSGFSEEVVDWLKCCGVTNYTVGGDFDCSDNKLVSLKGCPKIVSGNFNCNRNRLTRLEDGPIEVNGGFDCYDNQITTLIGGPIRVGGNFLCNKNKLSSFEGCPIVDGNFSCHFNNISESELFLYDCNSEQISQYYKNKHLSEDLKKDLIQSSGVDFKKNKI